MNHVVEVGFRRSLAYVVGINGYARPIPSLDAAAIDANALGDLLASQHGYTVHRLTGTVTSDDLEQLRMKMATEVRCDDRVLFYFAGHGLAPDDVGITERRAGYLLLSDSRLEDRTKCLAMDDLYSIFDGLPCHHVLIILDCCYAGRFRWAKVKLKRDFESVPEDHIFRERYRRFIRRPAWQLITSAGQNEQADDVLFASRQTVGIHSPFATALLDGLKGQADKKGAGSRTGDGVIPIYELYGYLEREVARLTDGRQTVGYYPLPRHDTGQYLFLVPNTREDQLQLPSALPLLKEHNPYHGLEPYDRTPRDRRLFFGRRAAAEQLRERVRVNPFTVVVGPSGSGKSSLVRAGLMAELDQDSTWTVLPVVKPSARPLEELVRCINSLLPGDVAAKRFRDTNDDSALADMVAEWRFARAKDTRLLLCIDQFEELLTQRVNEDERNHYLRLLHTACSRPATRLHVVVTVRSDYAARFGRQERQGNISSPLADDWESALYAIPPLTREELTEIVLGPATERALVFDPATLVDDLVVAVFQRPGGLPLLSFTLWKLYELCVERAAGTGQLEDRRLAWGDGDDGPGRLEGAISRHADDLYDHLPGPQQAALQRLLLRLIDFEGHELVRRRAPRAELLDFDEPERTLAEKALVELEKSGLVTGDTMSSPTNPTKEEPSVEISHEALLHGWKQLGDWAAAEQTVAERGSLSLALRRRLTQEAVRWRGCSGGGDDKYLWHASPYLPMAKHQLRVAPLTCNRTETHFIKRSDRRRRNIRLRVVGLVTAAFVALASLTVFAFLEWARAERELVISEAQRVITVANTLRDNYPQRAVILATIAVRMTADEGVRVRDVEQALHDALANCSGYGLSGHGGAVTDLAFSPNGRWLASGSSDGTVWLWDLTAGLPMRTTIILPKLGKQVNRVAISPDSRWLVVAGGSQHLYLYDLTLTNPVVSPISLFDQDNFILDLDAVAFSPNSRLLAAGGHAIRQKTIRVWRLDAPDIAGSATYLPADTSDLMDLQFSPNGRWLASGCSQTAGQPEQFPLLWDFQDPSRPKGPVRLSHGARPKGLLPLESSEITYKVLFAPNSQLLITTSNAGRVRGWKLGSTGLEGDPLDLPTIKEDQYAPWSHNKDIKSVAFSPDGRWLVAGGGGEAAVLWDLSLPKPAAKPIHLMGRSGFVQITGDGKLLIDSTDERSIRVWNLEGIAQHAESYFKFGIFGDGPLRLPEFWALTINGHESRINFLALSPDNQWLATAADDGTCRIWRVAALKWKMPPSTGISRNKDFYPRAISFSPDGRSLAAARGDEVVGVWNLTGSDPLQSVRLLPNHRHWVNSVDFSATGRALATVGSDARLWTMSQSSLWPTPTGFKTDGYTTLASFFRGGDWLATATGDGTVSLWDVRTLRNTYSPVLLPGPMINDDIDNLAISRNDRRLVAGFRLGKVLAWRIDDPDRVPPPAVFSDAGSRVEISADGQWLFTGGHAGRLFHLAGKDPTRPITTFEKWSSVGAVSFDPTGTWIAVSGEDNQVSLCKLSDSGLTEYILEVAGRYRRPFRGEIEHHGWQPQANALLFSHDGSLLIMGSNDSCIYVWQLCDHPFKYHSRQLLGHAGEVTSLAISRSGRWLLSGSRDGTARLWDLQGNSNNYNIILKTGQRRVEAVSLSPDARWACTVDDGTSATVWPLDIPDLLNQARLAAGRNLSLAEWKLYFPSKPYRKTFEDLPVGGEILTGDEAQSEVGLSPRESSPPNKLASSSTVYITPPGTASLLPINQANALLLWLGTIWAILVLRARALSRGNRLRWRLTRLRVP